VTARTRAGIAVAALYVVVLGASLVAPYDPAEQHRDQALAPPTRIHFVGRDGRVRLRPFVQGDDGREYPIRLLALAAGDSYGSPRTRRLFTVDPPGEIFLVGTDEFGRDEFSRLLHGGRISLTAGLLAGALSLGIGVGFGSLAGFFGRWLDVALMGASDVFLALPWLYLLLALRAALPLDLGAGPALAAVVLVIGIAGWARPARLIRGVVASARTRDYVTAAAAAGASPARVLRSHVLPEVMSVTLTHASILIPQFTLAEITLSFFGLGIGEPTPSWGTMIGSMIRQQLGASHWWLAAPAAALVGVSLLYQLAASALHQHAPGAPIGASL
jgi:peptide/nickel transport system permease protein